MASETDVDYDKLCTQLEQQELASAGGVATQLVYGQLLAVYLLQNDLANAKLLWKRIPQAVKTAHPELAQVWAVGQAMWVRDFPAIYEALNKEWSEPVKPIMGALQESTRKRALDLVSQAYSSINGDDLAAFLGMPTKEAVDSVVANGWTADAQTRMVMPIKSVTAAEPIISSEQQLARLTSFVSFLEN